MPAKPLRSEGNQEEAFLAATTALARRVRWPALHRRWAAVSELLNQEKNDRSLAIVAAAFLDVALEKALEGRLANRRKEALHRVVGGSGDFARKLSLAYCVGLIGPEELGDLRLVNQIRNKFAHEHSPITFRRKAIRKLCGQFQVVRNIRPRILQSARGRDAFRLAVFALTSQLVHMLPTIDRIPEKKDYEWPFGHPVDRPAQS